MIVLGLLVAFADHKKRQVNVGLVRTAETPKLEAIQKAYWPVWVPFALPFKEAIGVLIGGQLQRRR